jgi:hypothetical protein
MMNGLPGVEHTESMTLVSKETNDVAQDSQDEASAWKLTGQ